MTEPSDYVDNEAFEAHLAEYLKDESVENWRQLVENYPYEEGRDRFLFLPSYDESVNAESSSDFLVSGPDSRINSSNDMSGYGVSRLDKFYSGLIQGDEG